MLASLSQNTIKQYDVCLKKWWKFCYHNNVEIYQASVPQVIYFLTQLYNQGCQYGTLNSCRAALSLLLGPNLSKDDRLHRFFKGVFRLRAPLPKYDMTWDTNLVLNHLSTLYPNEELNLEQLSKKAITLLALATAHRVQTFSVIKIDNITTSNERIHIKIPDIIKTSRPGCKQPVLSLSFFGNKPSVCPATTLVSYINKTKSLRKSAVLFISIKKPHNSVGSQTLSRWIKRTLKDSGIDTNIFSAHSTRHASTSRAYTLGVSIDTIRNTAGWSDGSKTFANFYNRAIDGGSDKLTIEQAVIDP